jgi:hypothetical protein
VQHNDWRRGAAALLGRFLPKLRAAGNSGLFLALSITINRYGVLQPCNFGSFVSYFIPLDPDVSLKGCRLVSGAIRGIGNRSEHGGHSGCAI